MLKYPIGIQSFETIRNSGYVYVDKTDLVYKLAQGHVYFLARPRRFGKSLLISTLKAYFEGRKDLFEGLKMAELEQDWQHYPVLNFDFNLGEKQRENGLREYIMSMIARSEELYAIKPAINPEDGKPSLDISLRFSRLIEELHRQCGQQVVVLVDEYDKPLLDLLGTDTPNDDKMLVANRELLKNFFSVFKAVDNHLRFVMLTGITKFSQVSMFSGFNQPDDITMDEDYEALCGITQGELEEVFNESIQELAANMQISHEEVLNMLKANYDGYHFSTRMTDIYNPFSVINALKKRAVEDYWFTSGTPSYLVRLLGNTPEDMMTYTSSEYSRDEFVNYKADTANPLPMIFQAGYLTIKSVNHRFRTYQLDYPNNEVKQGMMTLLASKYLQSKADTMTWVNKMVVALEKGDTEQRRAPSRNGEWKTTVK